MLRSALVASVLTLSVVVGRSVGIAAVPAPADACVRADRAPPSPDPALARVVGQYGATGAILDISERCGSLFANGRGFAAAKLEPAGQDRWRANGRTLVFAPGAPSLSIQIGDERLARHDFGAEVEARIHAEVHADPDKVRKAALAATPPREPAPKRASDLVPLQSLDPTIKVDTLYATTRNFMGIPIYEKAGAYMQRPAAEAVARASKALHTYGYGLWVTDAYRPWYATKMFWDATPPEDHNFVADPNEGSRHNRGCAVDLTLYDLKTGKPVEMTGRIDEMSARSIADYPGGTTRQRWFRALLRRAMEAEGFTVYTDEWWHFDYRDWPDYGIGTATYTDLDAGRAH
jgi:D-alanyl-D-alanine dipeptidase